MKKFLYIIDYALEMIYIPLIFLVIFMLFSLFFPSYDVKAAVHDIRYNLYDINNYGSVVKSGSVGSDITNFNNISLYKIPVNRSASGFDIKGFNNLSGNMFVFYFRLISSSNDTNSYYPFTNVSAFIRDIYSNNYACSISNIVYTNQNWENSNEQNFIVYQVSCDITNLNRDINLYSFSVNFQANYPLASIYSSGIYAYSSSKSDDQAIISAIQSGQQQQHQDAQKTQESIDNVNDTLNDGSVDSDQIGSVGSNLPGTNGVLSSILNMPVTFFINLLNSLDTTTCPNLSFPIPFMDTQATIPCFRSIINDLGALNWFEGIGGLVGGLLIFSYCIHLGKTFNKMSDLDDTTNESWGGL